ncbi:hypothetical protein BP00DRAFT_178738 [Aspergillus indologenus CBS 114.80]|uniref:Uncharacterized protein n=1 Tax=Aspergillus indologenus CBS 114.80 TaxID=1450541 RepID=A0A2V5I3D3_9EURO|nr:hypothetical protein BP00DRAFT_178738 [Aspergillus indologenus CBS 114.80]
MVFLHSFHCHIPHPLPPMMTHLCPFPQLLSFSPPTSSIPRQKQITDPPSLPPPKLYLNSPLEHLTYLLLPISTCNHFPQVSSVSLERILPMNYCSFCLSSSRRRPVISTLSSSSPNGRDLGASSANRSLSFRRTSSRWLMLSSPPNSMSIHSCL